MCEIYRRIKIQIFFVMNFVTFFLYFLLRTLILSNGFLKIINIYDHADNETC